MRGDDSESDESDGLSPAERLRKEQIEREYDKDIKLMEGLFPDEPSKSRRLLATLEGH